MPLMKSEFKKAGLAPTEATASFARNDPHHASPSGLPSTTYNVSLTKADAPARLTNPVHSSMKMST